MLNIAHITTYQSGIIQSKTTRRLQALFARCLEQHALTPAQWYVIGTIFDAGGKGITLTRLAAKIGSTLASITETVSSLERKGWIIKHNHAKDGRSRMLMLPPAKVADCRRIEDDVRNRLRKGVYPKVTSEELATYIEVLYKLSDIPL